MRESPPDCALEHVFRARARNQASRRLVCALEHVFDESLEAERGEAALDERAVHLFIARQTGIQPETATPVVQPEIERLERHLAGRGQLCRAALQQQRVADPEGALGGDRRPRCRPRAGARWRAARSTPRRPSVTSRSKRASRCIPGSASRSNTRAKRRCGVHAGSPPNAAACEPGARRPGAVRSSVRIPRLGIVGRAGPELRAVEVGSARLSPTSCGPGDRLERVVAPPAGTGRRSGTPARSAPRSRRADATSAYRPGGSGLEHAQPRGGERQLLGQALGVGARPQSGDQRRVVAVVCAAGRARRTRTPARARPARGR